MDICIYKHTSPSGKCYIGQTTSINNRWKPSAYKSCYKFYGAIQKYGWDNFTHEIICICKTESEANQKEAYYIELYNSIESGYNILPGGTPQRGANNPMYGKSATDYMTDEEIALWKQHLSEARMGEKNHFYGKHHTDETKEKIRATKVGIPCPVNLSDEQREAISKRVKAWWTPERRDAMSEKQLGENNPMYGTHMSEEQKDKLHQRFYRENSPCAKQIIIVDVYTNTETLCLCHKYVKDEIGLSPCHIKRYLGTGKLYHKRYLLKEVD